MHADIWLKNLKERDYFKGLNDIKKTGWVSASLIILLQDMNHFVNMVMNLQIPCSMWNFFTT
jgi:hypothetical protein